MPPASRVILAPPAAWDEARLLDLARSMLLPEGALRPGDEVGGLVVIEVHPEPGAEVERTTVIEIAPRPRAARGATLDVVILLDASESMGQAWSPTHSRWEAAREALRSFLADSGHHLRLVTLFIYARQAQLVGGPIVSSQLELPELVPRGRSMTGTAVNAALAYLAANASAQSAQGILVLSDGAGEDAELERATARSARLAIPVHSLVFAPGVDAAFERLAKETGGSSQRATLPPSFALVYESQEPSR
jgi:hypothetical protein